MRIAQLHAQAHVHTSTVQQADHAAMSTQADYAVMCTHAFHDARVQVIVWGGALAVVAAAGGTQTPQALALGSTAAQGAALRHLGLETLCLFLAVAVLFMALRRSNPR